LSKTESLRIAAVGDIHCKTTSQGGFRELFEAINHAADVLLLCGDLTDFGLEQEAVILAHELKALRIPAIGVLGNHDLDSGAPEVLVRILTDAGVIMLDGDSHVIGGVGFAGVKGFGGGFGRRALGSFGENTIKQFVHESVEESLKHPFLGSSRLEEVLDRYRVDVTFHGHAHYGSPAGRTKAGSPVFNVAMALLLRENPKAPPFKLFEVPASTQIEQT